MNLEIWQKLLPLESRDITQRRFNQIHHRELNARRTNEITSAAKQAREYFRNASSSDYSVRPLLTFYGVLSLTRALTLLLRREGGEEALKGSHGLETVNWAQTMTGSIEDGLRNIEKLTIRTTAGLFSQFLNQSKNQIPIHIHSSKVDWSICHDVPNTGLTLTFDDLLSRTPDLHKEYSDLGKIPKYSPIHDLSFNNEDGFKAKTAAKMLAPMSASFQNAGYTLEIQKDVTTIECSAQNIQDHTPIFMHGYLDKIFSSIPRLHIVEPLPNDVTLSQMAITYMHSYILGMLVRYYPTHWVSLIQGSRGDKYWPTLNRVQRYVEIVYPELVAELIHETLNPSA